MVLQSAEERSCDDQREESLVLPNDEHNRTLVSNVHPSNWVIPNRLPLQYCGHWSGTAGLITAVIAASLGPKWP